MRQHEASCLLVAKVLTADGIMTDAEREFLTSTMASLGLTDEERARVLDLQGIDAAEATLLASPIEERRVVLDHLLAAALADSRLSPHETTAIRAVTSALGLD